MTTLRVSRWLLTSLFALMFAGCPPSDPGPLTLEPASLTVQAGETATLTARRGEATLTAVTWSSSDTSIASVTGSGATGTVSGRAAGTATVTATVDGVSATAEVTVTAARIASIAITPPAPSVAAGTAVQLTATATFTDGTTSDITATATWASETPAVATVTAGNLRGVTPGSATITATAGGVSGTLTATVTSARLVAIDLTPPAPSLARGTTVQLTATGRFSDATTQDLTSQLTWTSATENVATVSTAGLVTAANTGTSVISAAMGPISGSVTVTVTAATLTRIDVTPASPTLPKGLTQQFTATGHFTDMTTQDLTSTVTWSSETMATATIAAGGLATAVGAGTTRIVATSGAVTGSTMLTVTAATLVSIAVTPTNPSIARGQTQQLTATGTFSDATTQNLTDTVTWTSGTPATATVSNAAGSEGLATSVNPGTSLITATSGAVSGSTTLTVTAATLVSIAVTPATPSIARGQTQQLTATGTFSDATTQNLTTSVTWTSGTPATATVSNAAGSEGLATSVNPGTSLITATSGAVSGSTTLTVTAATLVSIAVTPTNPSIARGQTQQLTATGTFSDATTQNLTTSVTWSSGTPATATISNAAGTQGLATSANVGTSLITATSGAVSGSTTLTVTAATLVSIQVTPTNPSIARGQTQQFTATGTFSDATTQNLTDSVTWSSGTPATATISNAAGSRGLATSVNPGTSLVTATSGAVSGSTTLTVTAATLVSIQVTPTNPSIARGQTQQLTATGTFSDATTQNLTTTVTWSSGTPATATVSNAAGSQGLATSVNAGTSLITATSGAVSGSTTLTVTAATLVSIQVTPTNPSIARGQTQQLTATGTFSDATTQNLTTSVTWSSGTPATATISNAAGTQGLATSANVGTSLITATSGAVSGSTTLTVTAATLVSIQVTPTNPSIARGQTQSFTATGTFSDATTQNLTTSVTWSSGTPATATISNAAGTQGLATAVNPGTTLVTATSGAVSGSTTLTVTPATLVSIQVTPVNPSVTLGQTLQLTATGTFTDATTQNLTASVTWSSGTPATATVSNAAGSQGLASSLAAGTSLITATSGPVSGSTTLTVNTATLVSIVVTPANPSAADGTTVAFTATGTFSDASTQNLTDTVTWASTDGTVAQVSNAAGTRGIATALNPGTVTISATSGPVSGSTSLTVTPAVLLTIQVTPANPLVAKGLTVQLTATGTFSDASTQDVTSSVTWASATPTVAQVSNAAGSEGLATAILEGTSSVSATVGAVSGSTTLTVTAAQLVSIAVTPVNPSVASGSTVQLTATGTFSDASTSDVTASATWSSLAPSIASIFAPGLVFGASGGNAEIRATIGAVFGATNVTVTAPPPSVAVTVPVDGSTNMTPLTTIQVLFDRPMSPSTLTTQTAAGACSGSIQVSRDEFASCIGLGPVVMSGGDSIATAIPAPALAFGTVYKIRVTTAAQSSTGVALGVEYTHFAGFTTALDVPCGTGLLISQVYGGGGNAGAVFNADFIELHNPTAAAINLNGLAVQYASATGTTWAARALPNVTLAAGGYFLIRMTNAGTNGAALPTPDHVVSTTVDMAGANGKVALTSNTTALTGACPTGAVIVDFVGYGTANCFEGGAAVGGLSATTAGIRRNAGCSDSAQNATDFAVATPTPRNASPANDLLCACTVNEGNGGLEADFCNLQHPPATSTAAGMLTENIYGRIFEAGTTESGGANANVRAQVGYGPVTANPQNQAGWVWSTASFNVQVGNDDEYVRQLTAPATPGTYRFGSRFSLDGINWTYCDLDGAGSNSGQSFDPAKLGVLTVTP